MIPNIENNFAFVYVKALSIHTADAKLFPYLLCSKIFESEFLIFKSQFWV
jgi:hypothetical protein